MTAVYFEERQQYFDCTVEEGNTEVVSGTEESYFRDLA